MNPIEQIRVDILAIPYLMRTQKDIAIENILLRLVEHLEDMTKNKDIKEK